MTQITKLNYLLKSNQKLFHTQDLALLWNISNRNTLYTAIKRMVKKGVLITVRKGLYSTLPLGEISDFQLGAALIHKFCYVSCETILVKAGIIFQKIYPTTFVSSVSQKLEENGRLYVFRRLKDEYLYSPHGISIENGIYVANKERAVADMLYFNPKFYFDNPSALNWEEVVQIQKKVGYKQ